MTKTAAKQAHVDSQTTRTGQRTPGPYHVKREGQSHHVVIGFDRMPVYETTRLELARRECRRLNAEAARDTLANPKFAAAVAAAMNPKETIKALREQNAALVAALRIALAYVSNPAASEENAFEATAGNVSAQEATADAIRAALAKVQSHD